MKGLNPQKAIDKVVQDYGTLSPNQQAMLKHLEGPDRARMEAQMKLQNYQELVSFISNAVKKDTGTSTVIANIK